jgi:hypothetical protein
MCNNECGLEHKQLAEWLDELKKFRRRAEIERPNWVNCFAELPPENRRVVVTNEKGAYFLAYRQGEGFFNYRTGEKIKKPHSWMRIDDNPISNEEDAFIYSLERSYNDPAPETETEIWNKSSRGECVKCKYRNTHICLNYCARNGWILTDEALPSDGEIVEVRTRDCRRFLAVFDAYGRDWIRYNEREYKGGKSICLYDVVCWRHRQYKRVYDTWE